jgi:dipeptidyl aminopeptidase/acylaminoacyl peptidase
VAEESRSPDGRRIALPVQPVGPYDVYQVPQLVRADRNRWFNRCSLQNSAAWSPDGKYLVFSQNAAITQWDLWLLPLQGERKPVSYLRSPYEEYTAAISPDGRWLAYASDETEGQRSM